MKASKSVIKVLMLLFVCMTGLGTQAQTISSDEAKTIAEQWFGIQSARGKKFAASTNEISLAYIQPSEQDKEMTNVYVFNRTGGGFVAVAGDARAHNIVLGYSDTNNFKTAELPENIRYWFGEYARQIDFLRQNEPEVKTSARSKKFASLKRDSGVKTEKYLNTALWNQRAPYWNQTPKSNGQQCVTGCVATAMAEVMYYYKYPEKGSGSHSYTWDGKTLLSTFSNHTYDWGNMLQNYSQGYTQNQGKAVALLMSDCGIAVNMDYGDDSSGAQSYDAASALTQYFGYSDLITYQVRKNYKNDEWNAMLKAEIDEGRPVIIGAQNTEKSGGHEFVMDGYQIKSDNTFYYQINWGWGGSSNGIFALDAFDPNSTQHYNNDMDAIIHICPNTYDGWGDWEDFGMFGYEYKVLFNKSENVNVKTRKTSDNNYLEFEITDYGFGCIKDYTGFPLKVVVDKTKSVGEGKYLAYISNAIETKFTSDNGKQITLADKLSTSIGQSSLSYSYFDVAQNELHLSLIGSWDSDTQGYVSFRYGIETLNMAWGEWLPFAPSGASTAKATYNSDKSKHTSSNQVFYRASTINNNKQIKVTNWLDNFTNLGVSYDFILNLDGNTNTITFEPLNTGYVFSGDNNKKIIYHYKDSESRSCYYNPRTGTFYIYGFLGDPATGTGFNSNEGCDILQMDGTFMTLTDNNGYSAASAKEHVTVSYSRAISSDWGTLILPFSIKNNIDGLTFYYLQSASQNGVNSSLSFVKYEPDATIPANTPVVFKRSDEQITTLDILEENTTVAAANTPTINGETVNGWCPVGVYTAQTITDADKLKNDFYFSEGSMHYATKKLHINPFRTYFTNQSNTQIKSITTTFDGEATNIETLFEENKTFGESKRFNLAGQKVNNSYKGVVIMGNKKQLIR